MRLSTMWKVDRAITSDGRNPIAQEIVQHWQHDAGSLRFLRSSANFVYSFAAGDPQFLRFADAHERSREAIEAEIELLVSLANAGAVVARPVPSLAGRFVEAVTTASGTYHACVFPALPGIQHQIDRLELSRFRSWGGALGRLHAAINGRADTRTSARASWQDRLLSLDGYLDADGPVRCERDRIASSLEQLPVTAVNYGIVHGDFELDNIFWNEDGAVTGIIDFDECSHDWHVADVAYALRELFARGFEPADERLHAFLSGYRRHFELDSSLSALPTFVRFAALLEYGKLVRALDLPADGDYPEWLTGLARKLRKRMDEYRASLAAARG